MYVVGCVVGYRLALGRIHRGATALTREGLDTLVWYLVIGMLIGARLTYVVVYGAGEYRTHPAEVFAIWRGGLSFHGAVIGMACACALFANRHRIPVLDVTDTLALCGAPGLFFGRLGNFINGELQTVSCCGCPVGIPRLDVPPLKQTYAFGLSYSNSTGLQVQASRVHADVWVDLLEITVPREAKGDYTIDEPQCPRIDYDRCSGVFVSFDLRNDVNVSQARFSCTLQSGTIRVSNLSSERLVGQFAGVGRCITDQGDDVDGLTLVNGQFDVGLSAGVRSSS